MGMCSAALLVWAVSVCLPSLFALPPSFLHSRCPFPSPASVRPQASRPRSSRMYTAAEAQAVDARIAALEGQIIAERRRR